LPLWVAIFLASCAEKAPPATSPSEIEGLAPGQTENPAPKKAISWSFETKLDANDAPVGKIALMVDGKRHVVVPEASSAYRELKRSEYNSYRVPADAETASASWWAGYGDVLYVSQNAGTVEVFRREIFEEEENEEPFKRIHVIEESP
jgi:hypothetical protein